MSSDKTDRRSKFEQSLDIREGICLWRHVTSKGFPEGRYETRSQKGSLEGVIYKFNPAKPWTSGENAVLYVRKQGHRKLQRYGFGESSLHSAIFSGSLHIVTGQKKRVGLLHNRCGFFETGIDDGPPPGTPRHTPEFEATLRKMKAREQRMKAWLERVPAESRVRGFGERLYDKMYDEHNRRLGKMLRTPAKKPKARRVEQARTQGEQAKRSEREP